MHSASLRFGDLGLGAAVEILAQATLRSNGFRDQGLGFKVCGP